MTLYSKQYARAAKNFSREFGRRLDSALFNARPHLWPGMSREDWWNYWSQMTAACESCCNSPIDGGPSPTWAHARHVEEMGYRVSG